MHIQISVSPNVAPAGEVAVDGGEPQPFAGWLQLLAILAEVLPPPTPAPVGEGAAGG